MLNVSHEVIARFRKNYISRPKMKDKEIIKGYCSNGCGKNHSFTWFKYTDFNFCSHYCMEMFFRNQGRKQSLDELLKENVGCIGMSEDFIKGSNWCNRLWKNKIKEKLQKEAENV